TTWVLPLGSTAAWLSIQTEGDPPAPRRDHRAVYDPVRDRMIVFGGDQSQVYRNDTWELRLGDDTWFPLAAIGPLPVARGDFGMIYDPIGDRVVLFGGYNGNLPTGQRRRDTWALTLSGTPAWHDLTGVIAPPARWG